MQRWVHSGLSTSRAMPSSFMIQWRARAWGDEGSSSVCFDEMLIGSLAVPVAVHWCYLWERHRCLCCPSCSCSCSCHQSAWKTCQSFRPWSNEVTDAPQMIQRPQRQQTPLTGRQVLHCNTITTGKRGMRLQYRLSMVSWASCIVMVDVQSASGKGCTHQQQRQKWVEVWDLNSCHLHTIGIGTNLN